MNEDLWGDISIEKEIKLPVTILKEQATILGEKTNKILEAKVNSLSTNTKESVAFTLNIIAPALSNYNYKVLTVVHPTILVYPLTVSYQAKNGSQMTNACKDEAEFTAILKEILSSEIVHKVIVALISQSKAAA